jgi:hypothetical protein
MILPFKLTDINGYEIINYLNQQRCSDDNPFDDTTICANFVFEEQKIIPKDNHTTYTLSFHTFWNNWGNATQVNGIIYISQQNNTGENKIWAWFDEPVEGDGTDRIVVKLLTQWIPFHIFSENNEELYTSLIEEIHLDMADIYQVDAETTPEAIDTIIKKLQKAKSYIK